jgi:hypothetical protein
VRPAHAEVRRALVYVLANGRRHLPEVGHRLSAGWLDPYSSAAWFDGWRAGLGLRLGPRPVVRPETWLLATGYQRAGGLLGSDEIPS